ncbi:hypothetical protein GE061_014373 [Apolygus lucorum]|uniref:RING-type E3 ubiquitin transferase n=1 Tax=Apolygus lucorum TaxID=248454 RepID=A0A6A4JM70_APOLU|nr:hypothetical protein GE061_014373 [Apolygus lucorum]
MAKVNNHVFEIFVEFQRQRVSMGVSEGLRVLSLFSHGWNCQRVTEEQMAQVLLGRAVFAIGATVVTVVVAEFMKRKQEREKKERSRNHLEKCIICQLKLESGKRFTLKCNHVFHEECIKTYVASFEKCPVTCPVENCKVVDLLEPTQKVLFRVNSAPQKFYCFICSEIARDRRVYLQCNHRFHGDCLQNYFRSQMILTDPPFSCPMKDCREKISQTYVGRILEQQY